MQEKYIPQTDRQLSPYLPKNNKKNKNSVESIQKVQQKLQNIKRLMNNIQKNQSLNQNKLKKRLQKIIQNQKHINNFYTIKLQQFDQCNSNSQQSRISELKQKQRTIQQIYIEQMRISCQIQQYIQRISESLISKQVKLTKIWKKQQIQKKTVDLPQSDHLHNEVILQINGCQQKFNKMMEQADKNIIGLLDNLKMTQKVLIQQMEIMVKSRISSIETNMK